LQDKLVAAAGKMPILGPQLLWRDQLSRRRAALARPAWRRAGRPGVALVSQSSNIVINLGMQQRGLPVAYVACLGNAAVVGLAELTGALLDDPRVTAVGLYIEGIDDAPAFAALAEKARAMGKGVVAIKSGKTELSRTAAASHTASRSPAAAPPRPPSCARSAWPRSTPPRN
jgi:acyl-CoA synthetase (NDP forming)